MSNIKHGTCPGCGAPTPIVAGVFADHMPTEEVEAEGIVLVVDLEVGICEGSGLPMRTCRVCGCTDIDCTRCVLKTGQPCSWIEDDLCSACVTTAKSEEWIRKNGLTPIDTGPQFTKEPVELVPMEMPTSMFANLDDQVDGNEFLHHLAELTGDPGVKAMADQGMVGWVASQTVEYRGEIAAAQKRAEVAQARAAGQDVWWICSNCQQWQRPPHGDCVHDCAQRGFAVYAKKPVEEFERQVLGEFTPVKPG